MYPLHGSFLSLLQSLPVFLQGTDGVPRLTTGPPQVAVLQDVLRVRLWTKDTEQGQKEMKKINKKQDTNKVCSCTQSETRKQSH